MTVRLRGEVTQTDVAEYLEVMNFPQCIAGGFESAQQGTLVKPIHLLKEYYYGNHQTRCNAVG